MQTKKLSYWPLSRPYGGVFLSFLKHPLNLAAIFAPLCLLVALFLGLNPGTAKVWDLSGPIVFLGQLTLISFIALLLFFSKDLLLHFWRQRPHISAFISVLVLSIFATAVLVQNVPARHRVQSDESVVISMAQNIKAQARGGSCDMGLFSPEGQLECLSTANNFKSKLQGHLYAWALFFTDNPTSFGYQLYLILYFLSMILIWAAIWLWSKSLFLSLSSAGFMAFTPMIMFQFRSLSVEPLHVFLSALSLYLLHFAFNATNQQKLKSTLRWVLLALALALFSQTRQESAIAALAFILPALPHLIKRPGQFLTFTSLYTLAILPMVLTILAYRGFDFQGGEFEAHGWDNLINNSKVLWQQMTIPEKNERLINPLLTSHAYLAALGFFTLVLNAFWRPKFLLSERVFSRKALLFVLLFSLQLAVILENVSGDMTIKINQRYLLVIFPIFAFLMAIFFKEIFISLPRMLFQRELASKPKAQNSPWIHGTFAIITVFIAFAIMYQHRNSLQENIMYKDIHLPQEQEMIHQWMGKSPKRALYIYNRPWHFVSIGQSAIGPNVWLRKTARERQELLKDYKGKVYWLRGLDCWDKKSYHRKVKVNRKIALCNQFEQKVSRKRVYQQKVLNSYTLNIYQITSAQKQVPQPPKNRSLVRLRTLTPSGILQFSSNQIFKHPITLLIDGKEVHQFEFSRSKPSQSGFQFQTQNLPAGIHRVELWDLSHPKARPILKTYARLKDPQSTSLLQLKQLSHSQAWGELKINRSVLGKKLQLEGQVFNEGLGAHAQSQIQYALEGKYSTFEALIGLDEDEVCGDGALFEIIADDKTLFKSNIINSKRAQPVKVNLKGAQILTLKTIPGRDNQCDHTDWIWPTVTR